MKNWYLSKTLWINSITAVIAFIPTLYGVIPQQYREYALGAVAILNIILRLLTKQPIGKTA